jgi:hypothetical protein
VKIDDLIARLQKAADALRGGGYIDAAPVSFLALPKGQDVVDVFEIKTTAYRQIEMMQEGLLGRQPTAVPYSDRYYDWRLEVGFPPVPTWTLVKSGLLYRSLGYFVKGGELYVEYDKRRAEVVRALSEIAGFHVLDMPKSMVRDMANTLHKLRVKRFKEAMYGKGSR